MTHSSRATSLATDLASVALPVLVLALLALPPAGLHAQGSGPRDDLIVSTWLAQHLTDPNLLLLHVGDPDDYDAEHIPGARYTSHLELSDPNSHSPDAVVLEMLTEEQLETRLRKLGICNGSRIVVYWGSEWVTPTARVVYTLNWAGLSDRMVLLNGDTTIDDFSLQTSSFDIQPSNVACLAPESRVTRLMAETTATSPGRFPAASFSPQ